MREDTLNLIKAAIERIEAQQTQILKNVSKLRAEEPLGLSSYEEVAISLNPRELSSSTSSSVYSTYSSSYSTSHSLAEES